MGLYRTVSEINGDFSRKSKNFPTHPRVFWAPADGVPLGIGARTESRTRMMGLPDGQKVLR